MDGHSSHCITVLVIKSRPTYWCCVTAPTPNVNLTSRRPSLASLPKSPTVPPCIPPMNWFCGESPLIVPCSIGLSVRIWLRSSGAGAVSCSSACRELLPTCMGGGGTAGTSSPSRSMARGPLLFPPSFFPRKGKGKKESKKQKQPVECLETLALFTPKYGYPVCLCTVHSWRSGMTASSGTSSTSHSNPIQSSPSCFLVHTRHHRFLEPVGALAWFNNRLFPAGPSSSYPSLSRRGLFKAPPRKSIKCQ